MNTDYPGKKFYPEAVLETDDVRLLKKWTPHRRRSTLVCMALLDEKAPDRSSSLSAMRRRSHSPQERKRTPHLVSVVRRLWMLLNRCCRSDFLYDRRAARSHGLLARLGLFELVNINN